MALETDALETSFDLLAPGGEELVETFYRRLFAAAPAVLPLLAGTDLSRQKAKLLATLVLLRKSLRNLDALVPKLRELGARHGAYGAQADHYAVVGANLIASMAELAVTPGDRSMSAPGPTPSRSWRGAMLDGAAAAAADCRNSCEVTTPVNGPSRNVSNRDRVIAPRPARGPFSQHLVAGGGGRDERGRRGRGPPGWRACGCASVHSRGRVMTEIRRGASPCVAFLMLLRRQPCHNLFSCELGNDLVKRRRRRRLSRAKRQRARSERPALAWRPRAERIGGDRRHYGLEAWLLWTTSVIGG